MAIFPLSTPNPGGVHWQTGYAAKWPFGGVDTAYDGIRRILQMPGIIDVIDPYTLKGAPGSVQSIRSAANGYVWTSQAVESASLINSTGPAKLLSINGATFQADSGVDTSNIPNNALVVPERSWSIYGVLNITGGVIQYLYSVPIAPVAAGNERFSIGLTASDRLSVFDHQPNVGSEVNSLGSFSGAICTFGLCFSADVGVEIWKNGVLDSTVTTAAAKVPMSADPTERIFQLFGTGATGTNNLAGSTGYLPIFADYHGTTVTGADPYREVRTAIFQQLKADYNTP